MRYWNQRWGPVAFSFMWPPDCLWLRVCNYGLQLLGPATEPLFSERYGYKRPLFRARGWRLFILKPPSR